MKVIKPQRLGLLTRAVTLDGRTYRLAIGALAYVPLAEPHAFAMETTLWKAAADHVHGSPDEAYAKPHCEVLVSGCVAAPEGQMLTVAKPRLIVERDGKRLVDKSVAVFGNRYWTSQGATTEPEAFSELPLHWSLAYGGQDHPDNPGGKGYAAIETEHGPAYPLPNIEDPRRLLVSRDDRPAPAGLGPIEVASPMRMRHAGKDYGGDWLETRFPGPALDFDARFFQSAPEDQQLPSPWTGSETIRVEGMVPGPAVEGTLRPTVVKAMVGRRGASPDTFETHVLRLETVHVLPNERAAILIYRGLVDVEADDADDIARLMLAAESPEHPKSRAHYQSVLSRRLDPQQAALMALKDDDLMPPAVQGWSPRPDFGEQAEQLRFESRSLERAERGRKAKLAEAREALRAAGFEGFDEAFEAPALPAPPADPYDVAALLTYTEQIEKLSAEHVAKAEADKEEAEKNARAAFEAAGFDYDAEMARAAEEAGGPPAFSAGRHLTMLAEMAHIASMGDAPMLELERDLTDEDYIEAMYALEEQVREGYRASAHLMPPARAASEEAKQQMRVIVQAAKDGQESLSGRNLTGADLSGMDLSDLDLSGAMLEGANLDKTILMGANLESAVLTRASLEETHLCQANLQGANLGGTRLVRTDFLQADLRGATFMRSHLIDVQLSSAKLEGASFFEAELERIQFTSAEAIKLLFYKTDLRSCHFPAAQLTEAQFVECDVREVPFMSAQLDRAQFIHCQGEDCLMSAASLVGAAFVTLADKAEEGAPAGFDGALFVSANLTSANLQGTSFRGANFERATLTQANLRKAQLEGAALERVHARGALMVRTNLAGASLYGADLLGALLHKADLRGADLRGSNLSRSDLGLAWLDKQTKLEGALMLDTKMVPVRERAPAKNAPTP